MLSSQSVRCQGARLGQVLLSPREGFWLSEFFRHLAGIHSLGGQGLEGAGPEFDLQHVDSTREGPAFTTKSSMKSLVVLGGRPCLAPARSAPESWSVAGKEWQRAAQVTPALPGDFSHQEKCGG